MADFNFFGRKTVNRSKLLGLVTHLGIVWSMDFGNMIFKKVLPIREGAKMDVRLFPFKIQIRVISTSGNTLSHFLF